VVVALLSVRYCTYQRNRLSCVRTCVRLDVFMYVCVDYFGGRFSNEWLPVGYWLFMVVHTRVRRPQSSLSVSARGGMRDKNYCLWLWWVEMRKEMFNIQYTICNIYRLLPTKYCISARLFLHTRCFFCHIYHRVCFVFCVVDTPVDYRCVAEFFCWWVCILYAGSKEVSVGGGLDTDCCIVQIHLINNSKTIPTGRKSAVVVVVVVAAANY
jgi:hypothetical protein